MSQLGHGHEDLDQRLSDAMVQSLCASAHSIPAQPVRLRQASQHCRLGCGTVLGQVPRTIWQWGLAAGPCRCQFSLRSLFEPRGSGAGRGPSNFPEADDGVMDLLYPGRRGWILHCWTGRRPACHCTCSATARLEGEARLSFTRLGAATRTTRSCAWSSRGWTPEAGPRAMLSVVVSAVVFSKRGLPLFAEQLVC